MTENIILEIKEKRVHFDPVVNVKTIPANNKGRKVNRPLARPQKVQRPVVQRPVVQSKRFGMQFIR